MLGDLDMLSCCARWLMKRACTSWCARIYRTKRNILWYLENKRERDLLFQTLLELPRWMWLSKFSSEITMTLFVTFFQISVRTNLAFYDYISVTITIFFKNFVIFSKLLELIPLIIWFKDLYWLKRSSRQSMFIRFAMICHWEAQEFFSEDFD